MLQRAISFADNIKLLYNKKCPTVTFQITDDCNLQCSYCYQQNKGHHTIIFEIAKQFIDSLLNNDYKNYLDINECGGLILEFIGGEPFLQVDLIDQILTYFFSQLMNIDSDIQHHWVCLICTNGTLNQTEKVQNFIHKWHHYLQLVVTFDGIKEFHDKCRKFPNGEGSYNIVFNAINQYKREYGYYPETKITICPDNLPYLADNIKFLINIGYKGIPANITYEGPWTIEDAKLYYQELKKIAYYVIDTERYDDIMITLFNENLFHPIPLSDKKNYCGGNGQMLAIDWKGDLYPCLRYMESSLNNDKPPYIIGNVYGKMISSCDELKNVNRINQSSLKCILCPIAEGCGYCQAYNYETSGDLKHRNIETCWMHKARALANVYYWNYYYRVTKQNKRMLCWLSKKDALKLTSAEEFKLIKELSYR